MPLGGLQRRKTNSATSGHRAVLGAAPPLTRPRPRHGPASDTVPPDMVPPPTRSGLTRSRLRHGPASDMAPPDTRL